MRSPWRSAVSVSPTGQAVVRPCVFSGQAGNSRQIHGFTLMARTGADNGWQARIDWASASRLLLSIEHFAHFTRKRFRAERLGEEVLFRGLNAVLHHSVVRVAGKIQNSRLRVEFAQAIGDLAAAHAGHHDIRK